MRKWLAFALHWHTRRLLAPWRYRLDGMGMGDIDQHWLGSARLPHARNSSRPTAAQCPASSKATTGKKGATKCGTKAHAAAGHSPGSA